jgi:hypothetical protein
MQITGHYRELMSILEQADKQKAQFIYLQSPNQVFIMDSEGTGYTYISGGMFITHPTLLSPSSCKNLSTMLKIFRRRQRENGDVMPITTSVVISNKEIKIHGSTEEATMEYETNATVLPYDNKISTSVQKFSKGSKHNDIDYVSFNTKDLHSFINSSETKAKQFILSVKEDAALINDIPVHCKLSTKKDNVVINIPKHDLLFLLKLSNCIASTDIVVVLSEKLLILEIYNHDLLVCKMHKKHS